MTEPVAALLTVLSFFIVLAVARFFKTLDGDILRAWDPPVVAGVVSGLALRLSHISNPVVIGIVITAAALYVRLTGRESEPVDGMILGACTGAAATLPLIIIRGSTPCLEVAECLLAGAVAGYGVTAAALHVANRARRYLIDAISAVAAIACAYVPVAIESTGVRACDIAFAAAALLPLIVVAVVFQQWPDVRAELSHEASLGFIADGDVRRTAHPILRLGSGGWKDRRAHREFVRLANKIALRKRQQRARSEEIARLYQLEIIKLRMQIESMSRINREASDAAEKASDTMASSK